MRTAIIILNWNGADDTIACLRSLENARGSFFVVIADNGSADDSVFRIKEYAAGSSLEIRVLELGHNYGFAVGNNRAVKYAMNSSPDSYLLLNNDTEVTPGFLVRLEEFRKSHSRYQVLTPRINYYYDKERIWNCGGVLRFGFRRYRYAGAHQDRVLNKKPFRIGFVTGCALYFTPQVIYDGFTPFTDRFFFGEEDFEFSLRMKCRGVRMACVTDSVIYHKVSAAGDAMVRSGKVYLHLLNRYVDIRSQYGGLFFLIWRAVSLHSTMQSLRKAFGPAGAKDIYKNLIRDVKGRNSVTEDDFNRLVIEDSYWNNGKES